MAGGVTILIIVALIVLVLVLVRFKKLKHEFTAFVLIALILLAFFSFNLAFKGKDISVNNVSDIENVIKTYFLWFGNAFSNVKDITAQAVKMDWQSNKTT
ncbi:Uncharacterised protein [uncultured archaeon]|nr:Uncharacterised protein [uncultured archaeon]